MKIFSCTLGEQSKISQYIAFKCPHKIAVNYAGTL